MNDKLFNIWLAIMLTIILVLALGALLLVAAVVVHILKTL